MAAQSSDPETIMDKTIGDEGREELKDGETSKTRSKKENINNNFRKEEKDGAEVFLCNICNGEFSEPKRVKQHISKKHRSRSVSDDEDEEAKKPRKEAVGKLDESILFKFDTSMVTSTQVPTDDLLSMYDDEGKPLMSNTTRVALEKLDNLDIPMDDTSEPIGDRIKELEEQLFIQNSKLAELKNQTQVKEDIIQMNEAKINSLEMDGVEKQAKIDKFQRILVNMTAENKRLNEIGTGGNNVELKSKVKKLTDEVKEKNKKVEENDRKMSELMKKFSDETNNRSKAEAEVVRAHKMIDYLQEMLEERKVTGGTTVNEGRPNTLNTVPVRTRCTDQDFPGGCKYGDICRYAHNQGREELKIVKTEDCGFWLEGFCRFPDRSCRFIHDPVKKGSEPRQDNRRSGGLVNGSFLGLNLAGQGSASTHLPAQGQHAGAGGGLQLVAAGDQVFLQQAGQALHQVQPQQGAQQQQVVQPHQILHPIQQGQMLQQQLQPMPVMMLQGVQPGLQQMGVQGQGNNQRRRGWGGGRQ